MIKSPTRILICGLNWSGSGAVFDLLKEYNEAIPVSGGALDFPAEGGLRLIGEFDMFRAPGFIADYLAGKEHLFPPGSSVEAIKRQLLSFRFKTLLLLGKIRNLKDFSDTMRVYKQVVKTKSSLIKLIRYLDKIDNIEERNRLCKKWLEQVIAICNASKRKAVIFDQAIHLGQHSEYWPEFFRPFKLIIVHRDPRDIFAEQAKYHYLYRQQMDSSAISMYGDRLEDAIRYRIDSTKARMRQVDNLLSILDQTDVMLLKFEKLVNNYDEIKLKIQNFVGLDDADHVQPKKFFNPEKSKKNIGVYKNSSFQIAESKLESLMTWYNNH